jgi:hypothetical protein
VQDLTDIFPASSEYLGYVRPISDETADLRKFREQGNEGEPFGQCKLADLLRNGEYEGDCNTIPASRSRAVAVFRARSMSSRDRTSTISDWIVSARAAVSVASNCSALRLGSPKIAMRESRGKISLRNPTCFPLSSGIRDT